MVLTNFECWAHGVGAAANELPFGTGTIGATHHVDAVATAPAAPVSHISSNGYYGFSYVNAAHDANGEQNNNNNNNNRCVPNANDVNGITTMCNDGRDVGVAATHGVFGNSGVGQRCKKRYFVSDDDYVNCRLLNDCDGSSNANVVTVADLDVRAAKRCRFDDDYAAAQYCNDFFSLPSTQIGTQSCLMDTEDIQSSFQNEQQPPQQQVVDGFIMTATDFNNTSNLHFASSHHQQPQLQQEHQEHNLQQERMLMATASSQAPPAYQHQHNYQGHLHRANRDVSRCLLSHMI